MPPQNQPSQVQISGGTANVPFHRHGGADGPLIPLGNVSGYFSTTSGKPTFVPTGSIQTELALDTSSSQIWYRDTVNNEWRTTKYAPTVYNITTGSSLAINTDSYDSVTITALASSISFSYTGTPTDFQSLVIRIKDNGTSQTLSWSLDFASRGAVLPTATVASNTMTLGFKWDAALSTWDLLAYVYG